MAEKDTDPNEIKAAMKFVAEVSEIDTGKFLIYSHDNLVTLQNKARRIRKKFKNDYDRAGGKL